MQTKELLKAWKSFLEKDTINEISIKKFQEQYPDFDTTNFSSQIRGNTDYLDIISNSINAGQSHGPEDYVQQFEFYKNSIEPNRRNQAFLVVDVPGGDTITLDGKLNQGLCTATYEDIQQFQQARMFTLGKGSKSKLIAAYEKTIKESSQDDFETVAEDSNWIILYPKSTRGSIALARSYWDGSKIAYDKTFNASKGFGQNSGLIKWCTSVSGSGNMFLSYHRHFNLHMYYCIKKNLNSIKDVDRKLCISLTKKNKKITFVGNHASVNADNSRIKEVNAQQYIGELYNSIIEDIKQEKRLEIDQESYYRSISVAQYIILREANEANINDFLHELHFILLYSKDADKILNLSINDSITGVRQEAAESDRLNKQQIKYLADDSDENVRAAIAVRSDLPKSLFLKFVYDPSPKVRLQIITTSKHVTSEMLEELSSDTSEEVVRNIANMRKTPESALLNIINRHITNPEIIKSAINNHNLSNKHFRKLFDNENISPSIKSIFIFKGFYLKVISKQEVLDLYNEIKNSGQMSFEIANNFHTAQNEEIKLDVIDFCEKNSKGNKKEVYRTVALMLASKGNSERVINKIYNMTNDKDIIKKIASNINTPASILKELLLSSKDKKSGIGIRYSIAYNFSVTMDMLEELSYDTAPSVRYNVANNPKVSIDILERLSKDTSKKVSRLALIMLEKKRKYESYLRNYIKLVLS
jgi:hypothetical protein